VHLDVRVLLCEIINQLLAEVSVRSSQAHCDGD
jgi:hypothetical protein